MVTVILLAAYLSTSGVYHSPYYGVIVGTNYSNQLIVNVRDRDDPEFRGVTKVLSRDNPEFIVGDCDTKIVVCRIHGEK